MVSCDTGSINKLIMKMYFHEGIILCYNLQKDVYNKFCFELVEVWFFFSGGNWIKCS